MFAAQRSANTGIMGGFGGFFLRIRSSAAINYKKSLTLTLFIRSRANLKRYCKIPFSVKKTATTANQNPIIQHTSLFRFLLTAMTTFIFRKTMAIFAFAW
jgi:hypothetical protein